MKFWNTLKKIAKIRFYAGMFIVGLLFTVMSIVILSIPEAPSETVTGMISAMAEHRGGDGELTYTVYVDYTDLDGTSHKEIEYPAYSSKMSIGDDIDVIYRLDDHEAISAPGGEYLPYVILVVGIFVLCVSVVMTVKAFGTTVDEMNQFDKVDYTSATSEKIAEVTNNTEETKEYYFHWCKKLNQSYVLETTDRVPVYEANCDRIGVFRPYIYTFVDKRNGKSETKTVTHTRTKSVGSSNGTVTHSIVTDSSFRIDGENNWEYLGKLGYSLEPHLDGIKLNFDVLHYGVKVAYLEAAGVNTAKEGKNYKLGDKLPANGVYKVFCKESDTEGVFMAAFCVSRVDIF